MSYEDITLEMAIIERLARESVRQKLASQQLGEAWVGLENTAELSPEIDDNHRASA